MPENGNASGHVSAAVAGVPDALGVVGRPPPATAGADGGRDAAVSAGIGAEGLTCIEAARVRAVLGAHQRAVRFVHTGLEPQPATHAPDELQLHTPTSTESASNRTCPRRPEQLRPPGRSVGTSNQSGTRTWSRPAADRPRSSTRNCFPCRRTARRRFRRQWRRSESAKAGAIGAGGDRLAARRTDTRCRSKTGSHTGCHCRRRCSRSPDRTFRRERFATAGTSHSSLIARCAPVRVPNPYRRRAPSLPARRTLPHTGCGRARRRCRDIRCWRPRLLGPSKPSLPRRRYPPRPRWMA